MPTVPATVVAPLTPSAPSKVESPVTPTAPVKVVAPLTPNAPTKVESPVIPTSPVRVESPLTPNVPITVVFLASNASRVVAPSTFNVPSKSVLPLTPKVPVIVALPEPRVPVKLALPSVSIVATTVLDESAITNFESPAASTNFKYRSESPTAAAPARNTETTSVFALPPEKSRCGESPSARNEVLPPDNVKSLWFSSKALSPCRLRSLKSL